MVRLKIAYWEFDFEAVCPTLDHDLLTQAHIYIHVLFEWVMGDWLVCVCVLVYYSLLGDIFMVKYFT